MSIIFASRRVHISNSWLPIAFALVAGLFCGGAAARTAEGTPEIRGNRSLSTDGIKTMWNRGRSTGESVEGLLRAIQLAYYSEGFLFARIRLERDDSDSTSVLYIDEGEPARYNRISISGATRYEEDEIRSVLGVESQGRYRPNQLDRGIETLLEKYDEAGFPFVQVWMDTVSFDPVSTTVDVSMYVVEGERKKLVGVEFKGLKKTRNDLVLKLSGLKKGAPYSGREMREAYGRLLNSGVFEDVAYPSIRLSPGGDGVEAQISVVEALRSNSFSSALGYADRENGRDKVLSGMVKLNFLNIGGALRDLNVFWRNDGAGRNETKIGFKQRFSFGRPVSFGLSLAQIGLDTLYTWQSVGVGAAAPVARLWGGTVSADCALFADRNTFSEASDADISRSWRGRVGAGGTYTRGIEWRGNYLEIVNRHAYGIKRKIQRIGGGKQSVSQYIVEVGAKSAIDLGGSMHLLNEAHYQGLETGEDRVPLSEQFYIGGAATLRGYRENQFHGRRVAYTRSELLLGRSRRENGYLFTDTGYVLDESTTPQGAEVKTYRFRLGYGFGLRTQSKVGNIDISFGIGEKLSLRQTKIHVILDRSF